MFKLPGMRGFEWPGLLLLEGLRGHGQVRLRLQHGVGTRLEIGFTLSRRSGRRGRLTWIAALGRPAVLLEADQREVARRSMAFTRLPNVR
jgi:hypothetical protein